MTASTRHTFEVAGFLAMVMMVTLGVSPARGQQGPGAVRQAQGPARSQPQEASDPPCMEMGGGPMGMHGPMEMPGPMGMPGMEMGGMGPEMMPMHEHMMMRMMARNPKLAGKMMQMRADIMRAVADVLTRYGKQMESGQWPAPAKGEGD